MNTLKKFEPMASPRSLLKNITGGVKDSWDVKSGTSTKIDSIDDHNCTMYYALGGGYDHCDPGSGC